MEGNLDFGSAFLNIGIPLIVPTVFVFFLATRLSVRLGRGARSNISAFAVLFLSNAVFLLFNGFGKSSPMGAGGTLPDLWLFTFLPGSIVFALATGSLVDRYCESKPLS